MTLSDLLRSAHDIRDQLTTTQIPLIDADTGMEVSFDLELDRGPEGELICSIRNINKQRKKNGEE